MIKFKSSRQAWLELGLKVVVVILGYLAFMTICLAIMQLIYTGGVVYID